jgi:hypothetical protein
VRVADGSDKAIGSCVIQRRAGRHAVEEEGKSGVACRRAGIKRRSAPIFRLEAVPSKYSETTS